MEMESPTACSISVPCRQILTEVLWRAFFFVEGWVFQGKKRDQTLVVVLAFFLRHFQEMLFFFLDFHTLPTVEGGYQSPLLPGGCEAASKWRQLLGDLWEVCIGYAGVRRRWRFFG